MKLLRKNSTNALSRVEVLVIVTTSAFLACVAVLWILQARTRARSICCNCNLKQITMAFKVWAGDHMNQYPMQVSVTNGGTMELVTSGDVFPHFQVISNELNTPFILVCPEDKQRLPLRTFTNGINDRTVSYFVGVDATDSMPQMFLAGDRNIATNGIALGHGLHELKTNQPASWTHEFHKDKGNIGYSDGSVQMFSNGNLTKALQNSGTATNRLAMP